MCGASAGPFAGQPPRRGDPAGVPAHDLEDEHARRRARHRGDVERGLARRDGHVLRDGAEAGAGVGNRQIVVDGLRHADADDRDSRAPAPICETLWAVSIESPPPL